jgi:hypothetical protein
MADSFCHPSASFQDFCEKSPADSQSALLALWQIRAMVSMFIILLPCHPVSGLRLAAISRPDYTRHVCKYLREEFPNMVSYQRFAEP